MSGAEIAAVVAAGAVTVLAVAVLVALVALRRALADARGAVEHIHRRTIPALEEMRRTVRRAGHDVDRLDDLLDAAGSIGRTADAASRLAYESVSNPVIKALAFGAGTRRVARRLRGIDDADPRDEPYDGLGLVGGSGPGGSGPGGPDTGSPTHRSGRGGGFRRGDGPTGTVEGSDGNGGPRRPAGRRR